jgi:hypothetical protein
MILQEGRYYRSREGRTYGPLSRFKQKQRYQFFFNENSWTEDGKATIGPDTPYDLVTELTVYEAVPHVPFQNGTPKVDRVVLASKILPRLAPDLAPSMAARQALQYADAFLKEISNGNDQG